jgi:hypothetical protein
LNAEKAWELLEMGSSVMSGLAIDSKSDLTRLMGIHPVLANRYYVFKEITSHAIPGRHTHNIHSNTDISRAEDEDSLTMQYADEQSLRDCETEIRSLSGFESFQLPFSPTETMRLAADGPIVAIVAHGLCGSAALIAEEDGFGFLPLPKLYLEDVEVNVNQVLGRGAERLTSGGLRTKSKRNKGMLRVL